MKTVSNLLQNWVAVVNINSNIYNYEPLWESWKIEKLIGQGASGKVYKASKELFGKKYISAVKIITIDKEKCIKEFSLPDDIETNEFTTYFEQMIKNIIKEIEFLYILKGTPNIVNYDDYLIKEQEDYVDILIKMEYATPLKDYISSISGTLSEHEVIHIGFDICKALEVCHKNNILHRDIKEDNIFVSENNVFKLGDFGIAKDLTEYLTSHTRIGTIDYISPEAFNGKDYDNKADIYSLGIVLYRLANNGRVPFLPSYPSKFNVDDVNLARKRRLSGEIPPLPVGISEQLAKIIVKSCHPLPDMRFQSVKEFRHNLEMLSFSASTSKTLHTLSGFGSFQMDSDKPSYDNEQFNQDNLIKHTPANNTPLEININEEDAPFVSQHSDNRFDQKNPIFSLKFVALLSGLTIILIICVVLVFLYINGSFFKTPPVASSDPFGQVDTEQNPKETSATTSSDSLPSPSPPQTTNEIKPAEGDIETLVSRYNTALETAVNTGNFGTIEIFLLKNSNIYNMQKKYITDKFNEGTKIKFVSCYPNAPISIGKDQFKRSCYEITSTDNFTITSNGSVSSSSIVWIYSVCVDNDNFLKLTNIRRK